MSETIVLRAPGGWGAVDDPTTEERRDIQLPSVKAGDGWFHDKRLLELEADDTPLATALLEAYPRMIVHDDPAGLLEDGR